MRTTFGLQDGSTTSNLMNRIDKFQVSLRSSRREGMMRAKRGLQPQNRVEEEIMLKRQAYARMSSLQGAYIILESRGGADQVAAMANLERHQSSSAAEKNLSKWVSCVKDAYSALTACAESNDDVFTDTYKLTASLTKGLLGLEVSAKGSFLDAILAAQSSKAMEAAEGIMYIVKALETILSSGSQVTLQTHCSWDFSTFLIGLPVAISKIGQAIASSLENIPTLIASPSEEEFDSIFATMEVEVRTLSTLVEIARAATSVLSLLQKSSTMSQAVTSDLIRAASAISRAHEFTVETNKFVTEASGLEQACFTLLKMGLTTSNADAMTPVLFAEIQVLIETLVFQRIYQAVQDADASTDVGPSSEVIKLQTEAVRCFSLVQEKLGFNWASLLKPQESLTLKSRQKMFMLSKPVATLDQFYLQVELTKLFLFLFQSRPSTLHSLGSIKMLVNACESALNEAQSFLTSQSCLSSVQYLEAMTTQLQVSKLQWKMSGDLLFVVDQLSTFNEDLQGLYSAISCSLSTQAKLQASSKKRLPEASDLEALSAEQEELAFLSMDFLDILLELSPNTLDAPPHKSRSVIHELANLTMDILLQKNLKSLPIETYSLALQVLLNIFKRFEDWEVHSLCQDSEKLIVHLDTFVRRLENKKLCPDANLKQDILANIEEIIGYLEA